jgi:outer membrane lipoprotein SlyB
MSTFRSTLSATLVATTLFAGCASPVYREPVASRPYPSGPQPYPVSSPSYAYSYGVIDSIQIRQAASNNGIGVGAVAGGVVGGVLGNQVGGGRGKKIATVAGALGGAMLGHEIEQRNAQARDVYQIGIRLDNGAYRTVIQDSIADLRVGSRVRVESDRAYRY